MPYDFQVSGLYFYGDNGWNTTTSGVNVLGTGGVVANRTRADRSLIPRNNFNRKDLHRVDMRFYPQISLGGNRSIEPMLEVFNLFNVANSQGSIRNQDLVAGSGGKAFGDPILWVNPRRAFLGTRVKF